VHEPVANPRLFVGSEQKDRYYGLLEAAIKAIPAYYDLGANRQYLGSHSIRKGAETFGMNRPGGPGAANMAHRAGHSIGMSTLNRYMFADPYGDAFVGRTLAGLPMDSYDFGILPPHFSRATLRRLESLWPTILPGYDKLPESFQRLCPLMLASLVYHYSTGKLHELLPENHPIFVQPLFRDTALLQELAKEVIITHMHCTEVDMRATGLHMNTMIFKDLADLKAQIKQEAEDRQKLIEKEKEDRERAMAALTDLLDKLPDKIVDALRRNFNVEGVQQLSKDDVVAMIRALQTEQMKEITTAIQTNLTPVIQKLDGLSKSTNAVVTTAPSAADSSLPPDVSPDDREILRGHIYCWGGRYHLLKSAEDVTNFKFPSYPLRAMWIVWHNGDANFRIPYRLFSSYMHDLTEDNRALFIKARSAVTIIKQIARKDGVQFPRQDKSINGDDMELYQKILQPTLNILYPGIRQESGRPYDAYLTTFRNLMSAKGLKVQR
jgi:hypothetical protein